MPTTLAWNKSVEVDAGRRQGSWELQESANNHQQEQHGLLARKEYGYSDAITRSSATGRCACTPHQAAAPSRPFVAPKIFSSARREMSIELDVVDLGTTSTGYVGADVSTLLQHDMHPKTSSRLNSMIL